MPTSPLCRDIYQMVPGVKAQASQCGQKEGQSNLFRSLCFSKTDTTSSSIISISLSSSPSAPSSASTKSSSAGMSSWPSSSQGENNLEILNQIFLRLVHFNIEQEPTKLTKSISLNTYHVPIIHRYIDVDIYILKPKY